MITTKYCLASLCSKSGSEYNCRRLQRQARKSRPRIEMRAVRDRVPGPGTDLEECHLRFRRPYVAGLEQRSQGWITGWLGEESNRE